MRLLLFCIMIHTHAHTPNTHTYVHTLRVRSLHRGRGSDLNACLLQLIAEETKLPLHLITSPHLVGELALESTHVWVQLHTRGENGHVKLGSHCLGGWKRYNLHLETELFPIKK